VVSTVNTLRALDTSSFSDGQTVLLLGYHAVGDGGEGWLVFRVASSTDDGGLVFVPQAGPGHYERQRDGESLRADWFGADRTGVRPSAAAIQAAINAAVQRHISEVSLGDGVYLLEDTLHLGYGQAYTNVSLVGAGSNYRATLGNPGTLLFTQFKDRPAIAIQGARYSSVRNLSVRGVNLDHVLAAFASGGALSTKAGALIDPATWVDSSFLTQPTTVKLPGGTSYAVPPAPNADSQHAPYAGIAIDPYSGPKPADAYPNDPYNRAFSSGVLIENVQIAGFVVAIVNQPCNADGNGDFTKIHECRLDANKYCISIGNSQSRNVSIRDCEYEYIWTVLTNTAHGRRVGKFDGPIDNISGSASYQFADLAVNQSGSIHFRHIYFESQLRFGRLGTNASFNAPVVFDSCSFGSATDFYGYSPAAFIDTSALVTLTFLGCTLRGYGQFLNLANDAPIVSFESCTFDSDAFTGVNWTAAQRQAHDYLCGGVFCGGSPYGTVEIGGAIVSARFAGSSTAQPYLYTDTVRGARAVVHQGADRLSYANNNFPGNETLLRSSKPIHYLSKSADVSAIALSGGQLSFTNRGQATSYAASAAPGDLLFDVPSATVFIIESITGTSVTATVATNWRTVNGAKLPNAPAAQITGTSGYFILYPASSFKTDVEYRGDTTAGSPVITNLRRADGTVGAIATNLRSGDLLFHSDDLFEPPHTFPPVTKIIGVAPATRTVTVDQNATATLTGIPVSMVL